MSTDEGTTHETRSWKRWITPGAAVLGGLVYLASGLSGGDRTFALGGLAVMLALALALVILARRSETVAGLLDRKDERINHIDGEATGIAGMTLMAAVVIGFVVEIAQGQDGHPYGVLAMIAGVAYVLALVVLRIRR
ncbi:hypothetical protein ACIBCT_25920 [Streptosporangium sp. NPDC050855]|uniref:hypothetical protein n=1 Tax=Streptosporangium sp. NPDC050855 TaxID=3366194 RepID=UPI00378C0061